MKRKKPAESDSESLRTRLIGLGERSIKKSYFPELQEGREKLERFKTLLDSANEVVILVRSDHCRVVDANQTACDLLGRPYAEVIDAEVSSLFPESEWFGRFKHACELEAAPGLASVPVPVARDGLRRIFEFSITHHEMGGVDYAVVIGRDITERVRVQAELVAAKEAAERANRAKTEFLANMSHEIRTPLHGLLGMLQLFKMRQADPELRQLVEVAIHSGRGLMTLLEDILTLSALEEGEADFRPASFNPAQTIEGVVDAFVPQAEAKGLRLSVEVNPATPRRVLADESRLRQVLFNLVANSLKFTQQGGVSASVAPLPHRLEDGGMLLLFTVADTGIGIPDDKVDFCFEPFTQVDGSFARQHGGTGLGLRIVRRLLGRMGGTACMDTREGEGSTVYFTLRVQPSSMDEEELSAPIGDGGRLTVLVVEDDLQNRTALRQMLEVLGHRPLLAENGAQALDVLRTNPCDCVLMDAQMPAMDGLKAVRHIRSGVSPTIDPAMPIVALASHAVPGDRELFLAAGMDAYLPRPFDLLDLQAELLNLCGRAERRR